LISVIKGVKQWKGHIQLAVCETVTEEELKQCDTFSHNEKFKCLGKIIDNKIYRNYKLWKTNYIASDLLHNANNYTSFYSDAEKEAFKLYMSDGLKEIEGDRKELETILLQIYAMPVDNCQPVQ
jgi:hypothetical protein